MTAAELTDRNRPARVRQTLFQIWLQPDGIQLFIGPDGKQLPINLGNQNAGKLAKYHFLTVAAGEMKAVGYGLRLPMIAQPGKYTLELGYTNKRKGGDLVKGAVWAGELNGKALFEVK